MFHRIDCPGISRSKDVAPTCLFEEFHPPIAPGCERQGKGRVAPFMRHLRAAIASQGHFGIELDPSQLDPAERREIAAWIDFYKNWRRLAHGGETLLGEGPNGILWQAQGDGSEYILWISRAQMSHERRDAPLPLPFAAGRDWRVELLEQACRSHVLAARNAKAIDAMKHAARTFSGSWLAAAGLPLPALTAESAAIFHLEAV